ncbi:O-methyltransferase [Novosphingobium sp. AP12]|uniref:O-methyltransferase n=1 Tax=Novosphingobium sp. AP12 TaxID=1144305 RepID=UPI000271F621|nr:class I SAM-dependent methyltransferase [Novosphingobium sp. AP12]EJL28894.1 putative O-methyltransferase [Novosphingobium sp. AP12]
MDDKVSVVLDHYHQRIASEQAQPRPSSADDRDARLLAVGPETGRLINILARSKQAPTILEIGTSYGYSGIWLADAARASGGKLITLELQDYKAAYARARAEEAGLADYIDFRVGNALDLIAQIDEPIDFVLLDLWKDLYVPSLEAFYPKLNPGALIVADNMIRPGGDGVRAYGEAVRTKPGITSVLLPVGTGIEVSRYDPA